MWPHWCNAANVSKAAFYVYCNYRRWMKEFWQNFCEAAEASGEPEREQGDGEMASQSQTFRFLAGSLVVIKKQQLSDVSPRTSVCVRCTVLCSHSWCVSVLQTIQFCWPGMSPVLLPVAALVQLHVQGCCFTFFGLTIFQKLFRSSCSLQVSGWGVSL